MSTRLVGLLFIYLHTQIQGFLNVFPWNFILESFAKICWQTPVWVNIWHQLWHLLVFLHIPPALIMCNILNSHQGKKCFKQYLYKKMKHILSRTQLIFANRRFANTSKQLWIIKCRAKFEYMQSAEYTLVLHMLIHTVVFSPNVSYTNSSLSHISVCITYSATTWHSAKLHLIGFVNYLLLFCNYP